MMSTFCIRKGSSAAILSFFILLILFISHCAALKCYCNTQVCERNNFTCETDGRCQMEHVPHMYGPRVAFRCVDKNQLHPIFRPFLCEPANTGDLDRDLFDRKCCWKEDFCNRNFTSKLSYRFVTMPPNHSEQGYILQGIGLESLIMICCLSFISICVIAGVGLLFWRRKQHQQRRDSLRKDAESGRLLVKNGSTDVGFLTDPGFSGSGSGMPILCQRTVARQVNLEQVIGQGRYGEVWLARWHGEKVAVKIFESRDDKSWARETEIFSTIMLRHENILGFIASDNKDTGMYTQLWLITDYHENGSLFDYLNRTTVDLHSLIRLTHSIVNGLAHLHMEIVGGLQGRPAIAHRDLKTKNILVKNNGQCCIADLGLAVRCDSVTGFVDVPANERVGTARYLAPEVLTNTMNLKNFESFKSADMYALGLVFWEICRRCSLFGEPQPYAWPYHDTIPSDPTIEEVKAVVCDQKKRPDIPPEWNTNRHMQAIVMIMKECWYEVAVARLPALRVKKTLGRLKDRLQVTDVSPSHLPM